MSGVNSIKSFNDVSALLNNTGGVADSRKITFGANESRQDRLRRLEEITQGNPNIKLDAEAFNKIMKGGNDVTVDIQLKSPERRNLFIGAAAALLQISGAAHGAAYNDALGSAITNRLQGDVDFVKKYGNNYKLNPFGGATAQEGAIKVTENEQVNNENLDIKNNIQSNNAIQASNITKVNPVVEEQREYLKSEGRKKTVNYSSLSRNNEARILNRSDVVGNGSSQDAINNKIESQYAGLFGVNVGQLGLQGSKDGVTFDDKQAGRTKGSGTVYSIDVRHASDLTANGNKNTSVSLNEKNLRTLLQNAGVDLSTKENQAKFLKVQANATAGDLINLFGLKGEQAQGLRNAVDALRSGVSAAKRAAASDFSSTIFLSLNTDQKVEFLKGLKGGANNSGQRLVSDKAIEDALQSGNPSQALNNLFADTLKSANDQAVKGNTNALFNIFKESEGVYNRSTNGAKIDGLIGRQHVVGGQFNLNNRLYDLQGSAATLSILGGNISKGKDGKTNITDSAGVTKELTSDNLGLLYNGKFVTDVDEQKEIARQFNDRTGGNKTFAEIVQAQQAATVATYNEANPGAKVGSFSELVERASKGGDATNKSIANAIRFASNEQESILASIGKPVSGSNNNTGSRLNLTTAGSNIYTSQNNAFQESIAQSSALLSQNRGNADIIEKGGPARTIQSGETTTTTDQVKLNLGGKETTGSVGNQIDALKKFLDKGNFVSSEQQGQLLDVFKKAGATEEQLAGLSAAFDSSRKAAEAKTLSIATNIGSNIQKVNDFLSRTGNIADEQLKKAIGYTASIKTDLENQIEFLLKKGGASDKDISDLKAKGSLIGAVSIQDGKVKIGEKTLDNPEIAKKLTENIDAFKKLENRLGGSEIIAKANSASLNADVLKTAREANSKVTGNKVTSANPNPTTTTAIIDQEINKGTTTTKPVDGQTAEKKTGQINEFLNGKEEIKPSPTFDDLKLNENKIRKTDDEGNLLGPRRTKQQQERQQEFAKLQQKLDELSNMLFKLSSGSFNSKEDGSLEGTQSSFARADEILKKVESQISELFDYGFTGANRGRITTRVSGQQEAQRVLGDLGAGVAGVTGNSNRALNAFDEYQTNAKKRNSVGAFSLKEGIDKYNKNIDEYEKAVNGVNKDRGKDTKFKVAKDENGVDFRVKASKISIDGEKAYKDGNNFVAKFLKSDDNPIAITGKAVGYGMLKTAQAGVWTNNHVIKPAARWTDNNVIKPFTNGVKDNLD
ncbi:MAG: hypothetical protein U0457_05535 [Candidatus Sericytochromatia bacterium]